VLKRYLHGVLIWLAPLCFNILNVLLGGNLPPLGRASVIVEDQGRFLLIVHSKRWVSFPGGFMRWREHPEQTVRREFREETGLDVELGEMLGTYSNISTKTFRISTLDVVYVGKLAHSGDLRSSIEGHPCWMTEAEMRNALDKRYTKLLDDYFAFTAKTG
jgi:ADP-ribose pyrophosphatase YjhB (NUDIX family)